MARLAHFAVLGLLLAASCTRALRVDDVEADEEIGAGGNSSLGGRSAAEYADCSTRCKETKTNKYDQETCKKQCQCQTKYASDLDSSVAICDPQVKQRELVYAEKNVKGHKTFVKIISAMGLPDEDTASKSDPYVEVFADGREQTDCKTEVKENRLDPKWFKHCEITGTPWKIVFKIFDDDNMASDDKLGMFTWTSTNGGDMAQRVQLLDEDKQFHGSLLITIIPAGKKAETITKVKQSLARETDAVVHERRYWIDQCVGDLCDKECEHVPMQENDYCHDQCMCQGQRIKDEGAGGCDEGVKFAEVTFLKRMGASIPDDKFFVKVISAKGLIGDDIDGTSDPYVKVFADGQEQVLCETEHINGDVTPKWYNECNELKTGYKKLLFKVIDHDAMSDDDLSSFEWTENDYAGGFIAKRMKLKRARDQEQEGDSSILLTIIPPGKKATLMAEVERLHAQRKASPVMAATVQETAIDQDLGGGICTTVTCCHTKFMTSYVASAGMSVVSTIPFVGIGLNITRTIWQIFGSSDEQIAEECRCKQLFREGNKASQDFFELWYDSAEEAADQMEEVQEKVDPRGFKDNAGAVIPSTVEDDQLSKIVKRVISLVLGSSCISCLPWTELLFGRIPGFKVIKGIVQMIFAAAHAAALVGKLVADMTEEMMK